MAARKKKKASRRSSLPTTGELLERPNNPFAVSPEDVEKTMGRAKRSLSISDLKIWCRTKPDMTETSYWFGIESKRIEEFIGKQTGLTFVQFRDAAFLEWTGRKLKEVAIYKALQGDNDMLKYCLRALCGLNDRVVNFNTQNNIAIGLSYNVDHPPTATQHQIDEARKIGVTDSRVVEVYDNESDSND